MTSAHLIPLEELKLSAWSHDLVNNVPRVYVMVPAMHGKGNVPVYLDDTLYEVAVSHTAYNEDGYRFTLDDLYDAFRHHPVDMLSRYCGLAQRIQLR